MGSLTGSNYYLIGAEYMWVLVQPLFLISVTILRKRGANINQKCFINSVGKPSGPHALPCSWVHK